MLELYVDGICFFCANTSEVIGVLIAHEGLGKGDCRATVTLRQTSNQWYNYADSVYEVRAEIEAEWGRG